MKRGDEDDSFISSLRGRPGGSGAASLGDIQQRCGRPLPPKLERWDVVVETGSMILQVEILALLKKLGWKCRPAWESKSKCRSGRRRGPYNAKQGT
jgi:hypothetical protein